MALFYKASDYFLCSRSSVLQRVDPWSCECLADRTRLVLRRPTLGVFHSALSQTGSARREVSRLNSALRPLMDAVLIELFSVFTLAI